MKINFYTALLTILFLGLFSCVKKQPKQIEDDSIIVYDTPARGEVVEDIQSADKEMQPVANEGQNVQSFKTDNYNQLKKYNVIVATLTQYNGVEALERFFDRDGIDYFVVKNPSGSYYFIIHSSDSEDAAMKARSEFLVRNVVNKSRNDIWQQYYIQLTDAFILEK